MQINLKQAEIVAALQQYIGGQGIVLKGKTFNVTFTAGRKEGGLLADIAIENDASAAAEPVSAVTPVAEAEKKTLDVAEAPVVAAVVAAVETPKVVKGLFGGGNTEVKPVEGKPEAVDLDERPLGVMPGADATKAPVKSATSLFNT